jgi:hypothetical protein
MRFNEGISDLVDSECAGLDMFGDQLQLHMFIFDETFRTLQAHGNSINLAPWYNQPGVSILHTAFVGDEEVVLVDSGAQARIFSFVTLQFRCVLSLYQDQRIL